jgi:hypothetical protein
MNHIAARQRLMRQLKSVVAKMRVRDEQSVLVTLQSGERVVIYLVDSSLTLTELKKTIRKNTRADLYTLFVFAAEALPRPGDWFSVTQKQLLRLVFDLYWGKVYAYRLDEGGGISVYPVYYAHGRALYGGAVDIGTLECDSVFIEAYRFKSVFHVANFGGRSFGGWQTANDPMQHHYSILGVIPGVSLDDLKSAYRDLARQYHPDTNSSPDANEHMQRINEAYEHLLEHFREKR